MMRKPMTNRIKGPIIKDGKSFERTTRKGQARKENCSPVYVNVKADRMRGR